MGNLQLPPTSGGSDRLRRLVPRLVHHWSDRRALPFIVLEPDRIALPARRWVLPKLPKAGSILIAEITALSTESQFFLGQLLEQRARRRDTGRGPRRRRPANDTRTDLGSPMNQPRLGAFNGLHLIVRCRVRSPDVVAIVHTVVAIVHTAFPDQVLEAEASRMNAEYLERPVDAVHLLATIARRLGAQPERRRSPREEAAPSVQVELGDVPATLVDASSSGLRLSLSVSALPSTLQIRIPSLGISCRGTVVWLRRTAARPAEFLCGIEVTGGLDTPGWSWQQLLLHPGPRR